MRGRKRWLLAAAVLSVLAAAALWLLLRPAASLPQPGHIGAVRQQNLIFQHGFSSSSISA